MEHKSIRCNDTLDYGYATCLSTYGVFTPSKIDASSVPPGFYTYYVTADKDGALAGVRPAAKTKNDAPVAGTFISKEAISGFDGFWNNLTGRKCEIDFHPDQEFVFKAYFGIHPSIDCQIADAYRRRDIQLQQKRSRNKSKDKRPAKEERGGR